MSNIRDDDAIKKLAGRFFALRKDNQLSQKEVAAEAGMKVTQYRRIEQGKTNAGISHIKAISRVYEMPLHELFDYDIHVENDKQ